MTFSIFLFGEGKSILDIKINPKKSTKTTKINFIKNLLNAVIFPELVFFCKLHII